MNSAQRFTLATLLLFGFITMMGCSDPVGESNFFQPTPWGTYEFDGRPSLVAPERLLFGDIEEGDVVQRVVDLENVGDEVLVIDAFHLTHDAFRLVPLDGMTASPKTLMPGESARVGIDFTAPNDDAQVGELHIDSNDPDHPRWIVKLYANAKFPCLELEPADELDFGSKDAGATYRRDVIARNCSTNATTTFSVTGIEGDPAFALAESYEEVALEVGEEVSIPILFTPQENGAHEAFLDVVSDDEFQSEQRVRLVGQGNAGPCPHAIVEAVAPDGDTAVADPTGTLEAIPLDRIRLTGELSFDPEGGAIQRYEWSLVSRPADSAAFLERAADSSDNELWLDLAGEYVVELDIRDEEGEPACEPARMTLRAIADQDIHVQLVWDTPNDSNQNDDHGTDVDLHLLHPNGDWNERPWDCFWQNLEPDWGTPRRAGSGTGREDDPSLDIDDVSGWGPENINLDNPESGITYEVGVLYFTDRGYGVSYATVRIYIGGVLFAEYPRQRITNLQFWHVALIDWPGGQVHSIGRVYDQAFP